MMHGQQNVKFCFPVFYHKPDDAKEQTKFTPLFKWCESTATELLVRLESSFVIFKLIY